MVHGQGRAFTPKCLLSPKRLEKKALGHGGVVSCVGGWIVYYFWTFEKILSYLDLFEGIAFVKKFNNII